MKNYCNIVYFLTGIVSVTFLKTQNVIMQKYLKKYVNKCSKFLYIIQIIARKKLDSFHINIHDTFLEYFVVKIMYFLSGTTTVKC